MKNSYKKLFNKLEQIEPSEKLLAVIIERIDLLKRRSVRIRLAVFGTVATASLAGMIPSFQYVARGLYQSGFYEYISLLFSDSGTVLVSWKAFALSLIESLPFIEMTIFLAAVFAFLFSVKSVIGNININGKLKLI